MNYYEVEPIIYRAKARQVEILEPEPSPVPEETILVACSCVKYAAQFIDIPPATKTPADIKGNTSPAVGVAVLLNDRLPHIAIITKIVNDGFFIKEANYYKCSVSHRFLSWDSEQVRGFFTDK